MKASEEHGNTDTMKEFLSQYQYRNIELEIPLIWKPKLIPLIDFVLDNGGTVQKVKERFFGIRFYYTRPQDADEDVWDAFDSMVRLLELRSGHW